MSEFEKVVKKYFFDDFMNSLAFDENPARKHWLGVDWAHKKYRETSFNIKYEIYQKATRGKL